MGLFERLFPGREVKTALESISQLEKTLPVSLGLHLGFDAIKTTLRREILQNPDDLRTAIQTTNYSIKILVLIRARNIIWDELESGRHQTFGTRKTMTGDGLVALHNYCTALLEEEGGETTDEARASRASLRDMIKMHFGNLEETLDNPERATAASPSHVPDNTNRVGRRGICMLCGTIKSGSYVACEECGFQPNSDKELAIALILNEASMRNFAQIANAIRSGQLPEYSDKDIQKFIGTAAEARRTTGLGGPRYYTRAKTESLLTLSVQVAAQSMSNTIEKIVPGELRELSKERMLAVGGGMIKVELIRRAPVDEKEFIKRFFGKRLVLMSMQSRFPLLVGTSKEEFARRSEQAILDFDAKAFDVSGDKHSLERAIISFVLPNMDAVRNYMTQFHGHPFIGGYLRILVDSFAKVIDDKAASWS